MDKQSEKDLVNDAKGLARWFRVSVKLEIFGQTIFEWVWPPKNS